MTPLNDPDAIEFIDKPSTASPLRASVLNPLQERIFDRIQALEAAVAGLGGGGGTTLAGDVDGASSSNVVSGLHGHPLPAPGAGEDDKTFVYDHATGAYVWTPLPSTALGGDLAGTAGAGTVTGLRGKSVPTPTAGDDGKALVYNAAANAYVLADVGSGGGGVEGGGGTATSGVTEGFEDNDLGNFVVVKTASDTVEVTAAAKRSGSYGLRIRKEYTSSGAYARWPMVAVSDVAVEARINYVSAYSPAGSNGAGIRFFAGGVRIVDIHRDDGTGQMWIRWRKANGTYSFAYTNVIVGLGEFVKIRVRVIYAGAGTVSSILTEINGTAVAYRVSSNDATPIANNTFDLSAGSFDEIQFGSEHTSQLVDYWVDDAILPTRFAGNTYYVDPAGSDTNAGTLAAPWKTCAKVNGFALQPGDTVLFKRGAQWNEALNITQNGTAARRIRIGAYGTGARPIFDGGGNYANGNPLNAIPGPWPTYGTRTPVRLSGNWIIAEEFTAQQANYGGLTVAGDDCIARRFTSRWNVAGIHTIAGGDRFEAHDYDLSFNAVMSVNQSGGNDDSGAFGHAIFAADGYFHHATSTGHRATSHDYGVDGSCIEIYGGKRNRFAYIVSTDDEAFTELGNAGTEDTSYDNCLYYSLAGDGRIGLNVQGSSWGAPLRTRMHHCTIYLPAGSGNSGIIFGEIPSWTASTAMTLGQRIIPSMTNAKANGRVYEVTTAGTTGTTEPTWPTTLGATVTSGGVTFTDRGLQGEVYNNVIVASWKSGYTGAPIAENNNIYHGYSQQQIKSTHSATPASYALGPASIANTSPAFVNVSTPDLRLQAGSPAVNSGTAKGYLTDLDGNPRPVGANPDMGAYERQA